MHVVDNPQWFEHTVLWLKSNYTMVSLSVFEDKKNYSKRQSLCHLTFDDGDLTFYTVAFPVLKKHNVPVTIFVSPEKIVSHKNFWFQEIEGYDTVKMAEIVSNNSLIPFEMAKEYGMHAVLKCFEIEKINEFIKIYQTHTDTPPKEFRNMNLDEILDAKNSGLVTIGAHTLSHPILDNETDEKCEQEIAVSILKLSELINEEVRYFAYPNGIPNLDFGEREKEILRENHIKIAVSTEPNFATKRIDEFAFPRKGITYGNIRFIKFKLFLGKSWNFVKNIQKLSERRKREILRKKLYLC
jgi:peptidoglycan/xylan/chitin deacetylase (PgdA/CDA1 family)